MLPSIPKSMKVRHGLHQWTQFLHLVQTELPFMVSHSMSIFQYVKPLDPFSFSQTLLKLITPFEQNLVFLCCNTAQLQEALDTQNTTKNALLLYSFKHNSAVLHLLCMESKWWTKIFVEHSKQKLYKNWGQYKYLTLLFSEIWRCIKLLFSSLECLKFCLKS